MLLYAAVCIKHPSCSHLCIPQHVQLARSLQGITSLHLESKNITSMKFLVSLTFSHACLRCVLAMAA
jgi:hypothetical protein